MNLINTTDYRRISFPGALIVAPAAVALIVMLLWFGSLRSPDPLSAEEVGQYSGCANGSLEPCSAGVTYANGAGESLGNQFPRPASLPGEEQENERCLLPGIPCIIGPESPVLGQSQGVQLSQELRTY